MTRQTKTPRQRAQEALATEQRKRTRLRKKVDTLRTDLAILQAELEASEARVTYLAKNPDLPPSGPAGNTTTEEKSK